VASGPLSLVRAPVGPSEGRQNGGGRRMRLDSLAPKVPRCRVSARLFLASLGTPEGSPSSIPLACSPTSIPRALRRAKKSSLTLGTWGGASLKGEPPDEPFGRRVTPQGESGASRQTSPGGRLFRLVRLAAFSRPLGEGTKYSWGARAPLRRAAAPMVLEPY